MQTFKIDENSIGKRVDQYLSSATELSRSKIQKLIKDGIIKINDKTVKNGLILKSDDIITIEDFEEQIDIVNPEPIAFDVVYEDNDLMVINKPNGLVVHPAPGNSSGTLVNGLMYYSSSLSDINGEFRPGIVHRIDAYTTGLLVVAKNNEAHEFLAKQLEEKTITRKYIALVWGVITSDTGTIDAPIGRDSKDRKKQAVTAVNSKKAITHFKVLKRFKRATLLELKLETGRTHQIRVHMEYIGHPVVNDPVYGHRKLIDNSGQCLHAKELGFIHPTTKEYMHFTSELPECFIKIMQTFEEQ